MFSAILRSAGTEYVSCLFGVRNQASHIWKTFSRSKPDGIPVYGDRRSTGVILPGTPRTMVLANSSSCMMDITKDEPGRKSEGFFFTVQKAVKVERWNRYGGH